MQPRVKLLYVGANPAGRQWTASVDVEGSGRVQPMVGYGATKDVAISDLLNLLDEVRRNIEDVTKRVNDWLDDYEADQPSCLAQMAEIVATGKGELP